MDSKLATDTLKTTVGLLLVGGIWLWPLNIAANTVPSPKYTAQHPKGIVAKNWAQWSDGIEEQSTDSGLDFTIDQPSEEAREKSLASYSNLVYELKDDSSSDWEVQAASQDWLNLNRGDGSQDLVRIVIFRF